MYASNCPLTRNDPSGLYTETVDVYGRLSPDPMDIAIELWHLELYQGRIKDTERGRGDDRGNKDDHEQPAKDDEDNERTDCERAADELGGIAANLGAHADDSMLRKGVGWGMMLRAVRNDWRRTTPYPSGFRPNLVMNQESDVYRHVWGHAGGVVAGGIAQGAAELQALHDTWQYLLGNHPSAINELLDDQAGQQVGIVMLDGIKSGSDAATISKLIADILCVR